MSHKNYTAPIKGTVLLNFFVRKNEHVLHIIDRLRQRGVTIESHRSTSDATGYDVALVFNQGSWSNQTIKELLNDVLWLSPHISSLIVVLGNEHPFSLNKHTLYRELTPLFTIRDVAGHLINPIGVHHE